MTEQAAPQRDVRIGNCSGFFGDRISAAAEMVGGGPLDVLTGDWLAELTMLILARQRMKHGEGAGYARTFLQQMEQVLGSCSDQGIKVVANAGGLDPQALAEQVHQLAQRLGLGVRIGVVTGDDLMPRLDELRAEGETFVNLDTGERLDDLGIVPITANAYLGAGGIVTALDEGMDVVITGRVTDAALVLGPAAWWHGWPLARQTPALASAPDSSADASRRLDASKGLDALAGALVAGHVIECGPQATGGNYPFFADVPGLIDGRLPAFPIAEIAADGSCVITKHPNTPGMVTVGTVTAQLLYELGPVSYANPDVCARFDTIALEQVARDRVRISGVIGEPGPQTLKVAMNYLGGFRNSMTLAITGRDPGLKAEAACQAICGLSLNEALGADPRSLAQRSILDADELCVEYIASGHEDPREPGQAQSFLRVTVKAADPSRIARKFTAAIVEPVLSSYPGYFPTTPPAEPTPFGVYWPTTVAAYRVAAEVRAWEPSR